MKLLRNLSLAVAITISAAPVFADTVLFDQGPTTGTANGAWQNITGAQNFADRVTFATATVVNGLNYYSPQNYASLHTGSGDFHLKILSDAGGTPGSVLFQADLGYSSFSTTAFSDPVYGPIDELKFVFAPQTFAAGITYWVGLSGNGFDAAQVSVKSPQDGLAAMFSGASYTGQVGVGDQMYQLTSAAPVPEPETYALMMAGLALVGGVARRKRAALGS